MELSGEQVTQMAKDQPLVLVQSFHKALTEFGYPVTREYVGAELQRLLDGGEAKGGPSMFIAGWLRDGIH